MGSIRSSISLRPSPELPGCSRPITRKRKAARIPTPPTRGKKYDLMRCIGYGAIDVLRGIDLVGHSLSIECASMKATWSRARRCTPIGQFTNVQIHYDHVLGFSFNMSVEQAAQVLHREAERLEVKGYARRCTPRMPSSQSDYPVLSAIRVGGAPGSQRLASVGGQDVRQNLRQSQRCVTPSCTARHKSRLHRW